MMFHDPALLAALLSGSFSPATLFASGEQGVWYDPSDFSTMFQDSAGTTPVTAVGDPVGKILDKSGRGNHASQSTSASRPVLQQDSGGRYYLSFDGTDDSLATSSITPGVDKAQVFAGARKLSDAATGIICEFSPTIATNAGSFYLATHDSLGAEWSASARGDAAATTNQRAYNTTLSPDTAVISATLDIAGDLSTLRRNGVAGTSGTGDKGLGNFGSYPLYIGRRGGSTLPFKGRIYGLIVRFSSANLSDATISQVETWMNSKTGAY